jgi:hypothetical protein
VSSYGFVKKSGGVGKLIVISKAVRCGPRYSGGPCDQVALLNALDTLVLIGSAASVATF